MNSTNKFKKMVSLTRIERVAMSCVYRTFNKHLTNFIKNNKDKDIMLSATGYNPIDSYDDISFNLGFEDNQYRLDLQYRDMEFASYNNSLNLLKDITDRKTYVEENELVKTIEDIFIQFKNNIIENDYIKICKLITYYYIYNNLILKKMVNKNMLEQCFIHFDKYNEYFRIWIRLSNREIKQTETMEYYTNNSYSVSLLLDVDNPKTKDYHVEVISGDKLLYDDVTPENVNYTIKDDNRIVLSKCLTRVLGLD